MSMLRFWVCLLALCPLLLHFYSLSSQRNGRIADVSSLSSHALFRSLVPSCAMHYLVPTSQVRWLVYIFCTLTLVLTLLVCESSSRKYIQLTIYQVFLLPRLTLRDIRRRRLFSRYYISDTLLATLLARKHSELVRLQYTLQALLP